MWAPRPRSTRVQEAARAEHDLLGRARVGGAGEVEAAPGGWGRGGPGGVDGLRDRLAGMLWGVYIGDALSMPAHWCPLARPRERARDQASELHGDLARERKRVSESESERERKERDSGCPHRRRAVVVADCLLVAGRAQVL